MPLLKVILGLALSYLIGSIPTAYIFGKLYRGIDIRQYGSGNIGATNVFRVLGKAPGIIVLLIDISKGIVATALISSLLGLNQVIFYVLLGLAAVIGHNWTIFLQFKGGKGMATSLGVLIGLTIKIALIRPVLIVSILIWLIVFLSSGYVSLASIISAVILPILMVALTQSFELTVLGIIFCFFVVLRHRPNIKRLISKEEHRFNFPFKKKQS